MVSIERNEVIIDRETVLEDVHIDEILESGVQNILLHTDEPNQSDFSIIYNTLQKDPSNSEKEAVLPGNTVRYAHKMSKSIIVINPASLGVTQE